MASSWCEKQDMQPDLSDFFVLIELDIRALKVLFHTTQAARHAAKCLRIQTTIRAVCQRARTHMGGPHPLKQQHPQQQQRLQQGSMRHKQSAPKRRQQAAWTDNEAATASHDSDDDAGQEQRQQQHTLAGLPRPPQLIQQYSYAAASELTVSTETNLTPVGAIAEFVCATKAAGTPSADAAPSTVLVQLFQKDYDRIWQSAPHPVLLFSWRCPGEDEYGPMHEVCCEVTQQPDSILALLQQGYLSVSIQQLPRSTRSSTQGQQSAQQQQLLPQLLQPVQYATLTANSEYVAAFECDVLMAPEHPAVQAGLDRCCALAAATARAAGGATASLAQQSHALLEALAPCLPAQHVSLMAAAAAPELLQPQHRLAQQQQQQEQKEGGAGGDDGMGSAEDGEGAPAKAAAALTLWRLQLCVTEAAVHALGAHNREPDDKEEQAHDDLQEQQQLQEHVDLRSAFSWLVPHWSCSHADGQHSREFDAAQVYRVTKPSGLEAQLQGTPADLVPELRPYQRRAVAWMLGLEHGQHASAVTAPAPAAGSSAGQLTSHSYSSSVQQLLAGLLQPYSEWLSVLLLQPAVRAAGSSSGAAGGGVGAGLGVRQLFLHPVLGQLSAEAVQAPPVVPGGVLADEMGLGKTVELLSLIMSHRFTPGSQQQQQLHAQPLSASQPDPQMSRCSSGSAVGNGKCCSRCGESFSVRYTKDGRIAQETRSSSYDSDDDVMTVDREDDTDYVPRGGKKRGAKQQGGRSKRTAQQQQLPPLPPSGTGHHGTKRQRVASKKVQQDAYLEQEQQEEETWGGASGVGAAAAGSSSGGGVLCSLCMREMALQEVEQDCGTTLIVVPANILVQWVDELQRHTKPGSLSIKVYSGQPQATTQSATKGSSTRSRSSSPASSSGVRGAAAATAAGGRAAASNEVVTAAQLAAADIVLTTYDIIRREVALQPQSEGGAPDRNLRHRKRYAVVPTPLSRLTFWRLVLDEAQLAGGTSKAAEMAQHIRTRHRWAITGTPISHGGRADLLGLLKFLQVPHIPTGVGGLLRLLCPVTGGLMWRTAKADVAVEMGMPPQHHHTTVLRLSAIERHWYNRSHQDCAAKARKILQDALAEYIIQRDAPRGRRSDSAIAAAKAAAKRVAAAVIAAGGDGSQLDAAAAELLDLELGPAQLKKLLLPLLRLRQACCHPQVGASGIRAMISTHNSSKPLTMDQILSVLISRARVDAEESQRQLAGALNGLAALLWLAQQHPEAVATYREVLGLSEASKGVVRLDNFQLLHTLHNLSELLGELGRKQQRRQERQETSGGEGAAGDPGEPYGPGVSRTLRDDKLAAEAAAIRDQYLAQRQAELATAYQAYVKAGKDALPAGLRRLKKLTGGQQGQLGVNAASGAAGAGAGSAAAAAAGAGSSRGAAAGVDAFVDELLPDSLEDLQDLQGEGEEGGDGDGVSGAGEGEAGSVGGAWYIAVIDALVEAGADEEVADAIRVKLQEGDTYLREVSKNATTMANRFKTLGGLKLLLSQELSAVSQHQASCLQELRQLQGAVGDPAGPEEMLIEQAGQCGRCRSEMGVFGRVCRHCKLDEGLRTWEARLFQLSTKALAAGTQLDASEAARQAQAAAYRRVIGRGGLNEEAAEDMAGTSTAGMSGIVGPSAGAGARRADAAVSEAQVVRHPSEAERVLRLLQQQIGKLGMASYLPGVHDAAKQHLQQLEGSRKLFVAATSLSIAQRQLLYAHDELSMALLRITTRRDGEQVSAHEALYKLTRAEQVLKMEELLLDKAVAAGDLRRALGTLNYLNTIAGARTRVAAATAAAGVVVAGGASAVGSSRAAGAANTTQQQQQEQQKQKPADPREAAAAAALQRAAAAGSSRAADAASDVGGGGEDPALTEQQQQQSQAPHCQQQSSQQAAAAAAGQQPNDQAAATAAWQQSNGQTAAAAAAAAGPSAPGAETVNGAAVVEKCPICFSAVEAAAAVLPCGHVLCCDCADGLAERIPAGTAAAHRYINCPNCRAHTHVSDIAYVNSDQSSKHAYVHTTSTQAAIGSAAAAAAAALESADATDTAAAAAATAAEYPFRGEQQLVLAGSYGTKIEAVVRRVLYVLQDDPTSKVLVFSSWADVLSIVSHALLDNGVRHVFAKDRKGLLQALERFKGCQVSAADLTKGSSAVANDVAAGPGASSSGSRASSSTRLSVQGAGSNSSSDMQQGSEQQQQEGELRGLDCMDIDADSSDATAGEAQALSVPLQHQQQQPEQPSVAATVGTALSAGAATSAAAGVTLSAEPAAAAAAGPRVLLLLVSQGGLGLNLTEAQHVVLLEPLLDPALDVQAVGRVSRFGQTRETHVHRFIVQDTVEENVARLSRERAAAMDMTAAVPVKGAGATEAAQLSVREVAALVCSKWSDRQAS